MAQKLNAPELLSPVKFQTDVKKKPGLHSPAGELEMQKKPLNGFQGCHENALNESSQLTFITHAKRLLSIFQENEKTENRP